MQVVKQTADQSGAHFSEVGQENFKSAACALTASADSVHLRGYGGVIVAQRTRVTGRAVRPRQRDKVRRLWERDRIGRDRRIDLVVTGQPQSRIRDGLAILRLRACGLCEHAHGDQCDEPFHDLPFESRPR